MERCWILLGMMGAGKSSVGRALAELSGREFMDTDLLLQHRFGRPVYQIFDVYGEDAFRQHETSVLKSIEPANVVLATGGGIVTREANWDELRRIGTTIYLKATAETIIERLKASKKKRPLLMADAWPERVLDLLAARTPLYERADISVQVDSDDVVNVANRALAAIQGVRP
jgi:shikimate kinase